MLNLDLEGFSSDSSNIIGSNKMLSAIPSPSLSDTSALNQRGNNHRLVKRPSVDSGIHMSCGPPIESPTSQRTRTSKVSNNRDKLSRYKIFYMLY